MNNLIKSILKTAVYFLDQRDRFAATCGIAFQIPSIVRATGVGPARPAQDLRGEIIPSQRADVCAGVGVGIGAACWLRRAKEFAARSGQVQEYRRPVRSRFSSASQPLQNAEKRDRTEGISSELIEDTTFGEGERLSPP